MALDITMRRRGYASGPIVRVWYPFVFIGAEPHTRWLGDELALDERGYVLTGQDAACLAGNGAPQELAHEPYLLETSRPGVFAAGDVRSGSIERVASAVGEGAMAVRFVHARLEGRRQLEQVPAVNREPGAPDRSSSSWLAS